MISVCIITKNEKDKLERNLQSLAGYKLEVVAVDTGSTDGTKEMLSDWQKRPDKEFTMVVGEFAWCNDFAKARNYSVSLASNDKILVLDSDEALLKMDLVQVERFMDDNELKVGRLCLKDLTEINGVESIKVGWLGRVFDRALKC